MPAPITEWDGTQNFLQIEAIQDATIPLLNNETIDELADAQVADLAIGVTGRGTISTDNNTDFWILYGCQISGANPGNRTVSPGAILYQNQLYHVSGKTVTTTGAQVVCWQLKNNGSNVHETKELEIIAGSSGAGIKDEGSGTIYRYGEWITSTTPSSGQSLQFTASDTVGYTSPSYFYRYRRMGSTLEINFDISVTINDPSSNVTEIRVPIPDGFTKKTSGSFITHYGIAWYDKPTSTTTAVSMRASSNSTGTNMIRLTRSEGGSQIIMDNNGLLTLRGIITIEIE